MLAAVPAEQAQLTFSDISVALPLIEEKKLKALAVTTPERWPAIANRPTMIEGSVPDFVSIFWTGVSAPTATLTDIVSKLSAAIHEGLKSQTSQSVLARIGSLPRPRSPQEFLTPSALRRARWSAAVKRAGIRSK